MDDLWWQGQGLLNDALATAEEAAVALAKGEGNRATRSAHDAIERGIKGGICLLGARPQRGHGKRMVEQWRDVLEGELQALGVDAAFILGDSHGNEMQFRRSDSTVQLRKVVRGAHTVIGQVQVQESAALDLAIEHDGSTVAGYVGGSPVLSVTDTSVSSPVAPRRVHLPSIDAEDWQRLISACRWLANRRELAFYREREFSVDDAQRAVDRMHRILAELRRQFRS